MRLFIIGLAVITLGACNGASERNEGTPPVENAAALDNATNAANAVDYVAAIQNLSQTEQQGVFLRAIRDADLPCRDVISVEQVEPMQKQPTWRAQCDQGDAHLIMVKPDGNAQIVSRTTR